MLIGPNNDHPSLSRMYIRRPLQSQREVMAMPLSSRPGRRYTLQEFERLREAAPAGLRYEFLDGDILVTPSPNLIHQRIILDLAVQLRPYVRQNELGELVISPFDARFGD